MHVADYVWYITVGLLLALLAFDVFVIGRRPHEPTTRESALAIAFYVGLAVVFGLGVWVFSGGQYAGEFFAGWLTEYSLLRRSRAPKRRWPIPTPTPSAPRSRATARGCLSAVLRR